MPTEAIVGSHPSLGQFIQAFESAYAGNRAPELRAFLPEREHPLFGQVLRELVRVDLELAWRSGHCKRLADYQEIVPELFHDRVGLGEVAFEEYRQRLQAGENPSPGEYQERYDIPTTTWPVASTSQVVRRPPSHVQSSSESSYETNVHALGEAALAFREFRVRDENADSAAIASWQGSFTGNCEHARLFCELYRSQPSAADRLAEATTSMPRVGTDFLGFRLVKELGQGAFATVFLARQGNLADRPVVLKISGDVFGEAQTLAQLQHSHIVPIYSVHRDGPFQAVCMPYFGATTLANILSQVQSSPALPASGKLFVSTLDQRRSSTRFGASSQSWSGQPETTGEGFVPIVARSGPDTLGKLAEFSYVEAVMWMAARLADGLGHAHERGIMHRDLKPANILLTDEGQPMLLDFNLSADTKQSGRAEMVSIGGTLPYMAPEHLEAFRGLPRQVDARSDVYSLGVILYEFLTGKHPFPHYRGATGPVLNAMISDRLRPPPGIRHSNGAVSPAVEAIVCRCLMPNPCQRYQTARELQEDVERHLAHLPLKHTREPSIRERTQKWIRRHPRLTSSTTVGLCAAVLLAVLATGFVMRGRAVARREAVDLLHAFQDQLRIGQFLLCARTIGKEEINEGIDVCRSALDRYRILQDPGWQAAAVVRDLNSEDQQRLQQDVGETLLLLAHATRRHADCQPDRGQRLENIQVAMRLNSIAEAQAAGGNAPHALWIQRAELADLLDQKGEVNRARALANVTPLRTTRDLYLAAHAHAQQGDYRKALPLLLDATHRDPENFPAWAVRGNCHDALGQHAEAVACYCACIALRPDFYQSWYNRGLVYLHQRFYEQARNDFDRAILLRPSLADAYINRALAREGLNDYEGAVRDLSEALERGTPRTRVYFMRAYARERAGDKIGAQRDRDEGLRQTPADEKSWIARALARLERDPQGALSDLEKALDINSRSIDALQNKAHVLAERLGRVEEAIRVLDAAISHMPDFVPSRAGRGVYHARLGRRAAALEDAREALIRDTKPPNLYQVACIYALTSREQPIDRLKAFELLSAALRSGFGLDLIATDQDLDPIRAAPEFQRLVLAAQALHRK